MARLIENLDAKVTALDRPYVINLSTGKVRAVLAQCGLPVEAWVTRCGWGFGVCRHRTTHELPAERGRLCERCLPAERALADRPPGPAACQQGGLGESVPSA